MGDYPRALETADRDFGYFGPLRLVMLGRVEEAIALLKEKELTVSERIGQVFMISLRALLEGNRELSLALSDELMNGSFPDPEGGYYLARQLAYLRRRPRDAPAEEDRRQRLLLLPTNGFRSLARSNSWRCRVRTDFGKSTDAASGGNRGVQE